MTDNPPFSERRREHRVEGRIEVHFGETSEAGRALAAYSVNFSTGGLCLKTRREYAVGAKLHLALRVAGDPIELLGVVAWTRNGAIGVRFEGVTPEARARLEALVDAARP